MFFLQTNQSQVTVFDNDFGITARSDEVGHFLVRSFVPEPRPIALLAAGILLLALRGTYRTPWTTIENS